MAIKVTGQQIKQGLSKIADFFKKQKTPTPSGSLPTQPKDYFDDLWDGVKGFIVPAGAETADLVVREAMEEGSDKDLVRTALQSAAVGSMLYQGRKGWIKRGKNKLEKKLNKENNPDTNKPYTDAEKSKALQDYDKKELPRPVVWGLKATPFAGAADVVSSLFEKNSLEGSENDPKKTLYSDSERYNIRKNLRTTFKNLYDRILTEDDFAEYEWNELTRQGQTYYDSRTARDTLQKHNTITRTVPNLIGSTFGIDSKNILPFIGTKIKDRYETNDTPFMKFTQGLYQVQDAIQKGNRLALDDKLKFKFSDLKDADLDRFDNYIKVLAKKDPKQAKILLQNFSDVGFGGKSKEGYKEYAKFHGIDLD